MESSNSPMNLLDLPHCVLLEIYDYLSYEDVSKNRLVCRRVDQICQQILNRGFNKAVHLQVRIFKRIKSLLPRRESERRNHCLARHADILTSIETRISMLSMTYCKYMDLNLCCFIPGRVLDEIFRILHLVSKTRKQLRPHEVLQELRDISSMAIEHFDEKIANTLKTYVDNSGRQCTSSSESRRLSSSSSLSGISVFTVGGNSVGWNTGAGSSSSSLSPSSGYGIPGVPMPHRVWQMSQGNLFHTIKSPPSFGDLETSGSETVSCHEEYRCFEARATMRQFKKLEVEHKKGIVKVQRMQQIQTHQARRLQQALGVVAEMTTQIVELKKRVEDLDAKNREILANIKQIQTGEIVPSTSVKTSATLATIAPSHTVVNATGTEATAPLAKKRRHEDVNVPSVAPITVVSTLCTEVDMNDSNSDTVMKKPKT